MVVLLLLDVIVRNWIIQDNSVRQFIIETSQLSIIDPDIAMIETNELDDSRKKKKQPSRSVGTVEYSSQLDDETCSLVAKGKRTVTRIVMISDQVDLEAVDATMRHQNGDGFSHCCF